MDPTVTGNMSEAILIANHCCLCESRVVFFQWIGMVSAAVAEICRTEKGGEQPQLRLRLPKPVLVQKINTVSQPLTRNLLFRLQPRGTHTNWRVPTQ